MTTAELYAVFLQHPSVQTDTRALQKGDLFFALKGPHFNGNLFALQALAAGAAYAIVDEDITPTPDPLDPTHPTDQQSFPDRLIRVPDVLTALQNLALYHRQQFKIPFIAITGSNGKTTSKELVAAVLSSHFKTHTTAGNLNNHIGVPLTLLRTPPGTEMAVIEMGANHQQEIASYCRYTLPTAGIITNCGKAHLEGFGGEEGVRKGKGELFDFVRDHQGLVFAYANYDYLLPMRAGIEKVVLYGNAASPETLATTEEERQENLAPSHPFAAVDVLGRGLQQEPFLTVQIEKDLLRSISPSVALDNNLEQDSSTQSPSQPTSAPWTIATHLVGDYNLPNVLCAVAIGQYYGVPNAKIKAAIENYLPSNSRSQLMERGSNKIILDAYNANPSSMKVAIENFAALHAKQKVLLLGGMMELGAESLAEHQSLVSLLQKYTWTQVVLVGGDFEKVQHPYLFFPTAAAAGEWLNAQSFEHTHILVKGSRSFKMETVLAQSR